MLPRSKVKRPAAKQSSPVGADPSPTSPATPAGLPQQHLETNATFRTTVQWMQGQGRVFQIRPGESDYIDQNDDRWLTYAFEEHIRRGEAQRRYAGRRTTAIAFILLVVAVLAARWPVWDRLVKVDVTRHHAILELSEDATTSDIKKAYRRLAKRWHPDHNPNCGQCKQKMMQIMEAYDVLMARGDKSTRNEMLDKYAEALGQLLSIGYFRFFSMNTNVAIFIRSVIPTMSLGTAVGTHVALYLTSLVLSATYVGQFNFMFSIPAVLSLVREASNVPLMPLPDGLQLVGAFYVPAVLAHYFSEHFIVPDAFVVKCFLGFIIVMSHIVQYRATLFDNFMQRRCLVPLGYGVPVNASGGYSLSMVLKVEMFFLFEDTLAFAMGIPAPYRLAVWAMHLLFFFQFMTLRCTTVWEEQTVLSVSKLNKAKKNEEKRLAALEAYQEETSQQRQVSQPAPSAGSDVVAPGGQAGSVIRDHPVASSSDIPRWAAVMSLEEVPLEMQQYFAAGVDKTPVVLADDFWRQLGKEGNSVSVDSGAPPGRVLGEVIPEADQLSTATCVLLAATMAFSLSGFARIV